MNVLHPVVRGRPGGEGSKMAWLASTFYKRPKTITKITFAERNRPKIRFLSRDGAALGSETLFPVIVSSSNATSCGGTKPLLYLDMTI